MGKLFKEEIEKPMGGLSLMIIMTVIWTEISLLFITDNTYRLACVIFLGVVIYFIYNYMQFAKLKARLEEGKQITEAEKKQRKWFMIIFAAEGIAIFLAKNILVNVHHDDLFISAMALIVGLHFFPLAMIYKRAIYYYVAAWTTAVAVTGLVLICQNILTEQIVNAIVGIGCATSTSLLGMKMVYEGRKILSFENNA